MGSFVYRQPSPPIRNELGGNLMGAQEAAVATSSWQLAAGLGVVATQGVAASSASKGKKRGLSASQKRRENR
jgi:hypothetical protein